MRVEYALKQTDRMILRVLGVHGATSHRALRRIIEVLPTDQPDLDDTIKRCAYLAESCTPADGKTIWVNLRSGRHQHWLEPYIATLMQLGLIDRAQQTREGFPISSIPGFHSVPASFEDAHDYDYTYSLTQAGNEVLARMNAGRRVVLRPPSPSRGTIFVASAFGRGDVDTLYTSALYPACHRLGYTPVRVDMTEPPATITESIIKGVTDAECLIADLTYARPSVYFEVGYAFGLGIALLLTCRKDHQAGVEDAARIHFDLAQFKISFWELDPVNNTIQWSEGMEPSDRLQNIVANRACQS